MGRHTVVLVGLFCLVFLVGIVFASAQSPTPTPSVAQTNQTAQLTKNASLMETGYAINSEDNSTVRFIAAYAENSTGLVRLIQGAACKISFSDSPSPQPMAFNLDIGYEFTKVFRESAKLTFTVTCSHPKYIDKTLSKPVEIFLERTEVVLLQPTGKVTTRDVDFVCEARGTKPLSISLYSDTSGEWKIRASANIKGSGSPYRVNFKEEDVPDGSYSWDCAAETPKGLVVFAPAKQPFTVKFSPLSGNCTESLDCGLWKPDICPPEGIFTRACNKTVSCGYKTTRICTPVKEENVSSDGESAIITNAPEEGRKQSAESTGGLGLLPILLVVILVACGAAFYFLKIKKKKEPKKEDVFGNEDFEDEDLGEGEPEGR